MATASIFLPATSAILGVATSAIFTTTTGTTPVVPVLEFDASTDQQAYFLTQLPAYSSALTVNLFWSGESSTTTSHSVDWEVSIAAITPGTDTDELDNLSYGTAVTNTSDVLGTNGNAVQKSTHSSVTVTGLAAGDLVVVKINRDADDAADDLAEPAWIYGIELTYTTA